MIKSIARGLSLAAFVALGTASGAHAQQAVTIYCENASGIFKPVSPSSPCPVTGSASAPLPTVPGYQTPVAGGQMGLTIAAATALTVPATAKAAVVTIEGTSVRFRDDGTDPTASIGQGPFVAGYVLYFYNDAMNAVKFIQTSATATLNVSYYK